MIVDKTVLEADSQPQEILHRHEQINYLSEILEPVADGDRVDGALIYGPTGTGKTATSRFLCDRLEHESADIQTAYIDCWSNSNRPAILHRLLEESNLPSTSLHRRTPSDELSKELRQELDSPFVVILDEADQIEDQAVLYELYENPLVTKLLIANDDEEFFAALEQRVDSRLVTIPRIHFRKYTDNELVSILEARAEAGLEPGVIGHDEFLTIADAAAGDARVAIGILRNVAEYATRDGLERITTRDIREHVPIARREVRQKTISSLNPHQRVLLELLVEHGELGMSDLYPKYEDAVDDPYVTRTIRTYLNKMVHYNLVEIEGKRKKRRYRPAPEIDPDVFNREAGAIGTTYEVE